MQKTYKRILLGKQADAFVQLLLALILLLAVCGIPHAFYIVLCTLCTFQLFSTMLWLYLLREELNRLWIGLAVRFVFILIAAVGLAASCNNDLHFMYYLALLTYPVLGPVYLLLTFDEIRHYRRLYEKEPV